jgi:hypothetical protein
VADLSSSNMRTQLRKNQGGGKDFEVREKREK